MFAQLLQNPQVQDLLARYVTQPQGSAPQYANSGLARFGVGQQYSLPQYTPPTYNAPSLSPSQVTYVNGGQGDTDTVPWGKHLFPGLPIAITKKPDISPPGK